MKTELSKPVRERMRYSDQYKEEAHRSAGSELTIDMRQKISR